MSKPSSLDRIAEYQKKIDGEVSSLQKEIENDVKALAEKIQILEQLGMRDILNDSGLQKAISAIFPKQPTRAKAAQSKSIGPKTRKKRNRKGGNATDLILAVAPKSPDNPADTSWFIEKLKTKKISPNTIKQTLSKMVKEGLLKKPMRGAYLAK